MPVSGGGVGSRPAPPHEGRSHRGQEGTATAEVAIALVGLAVVMAAVVGLIQLGLAKVSTQDGATAAARAVARGEAESVAVARAQQVAGQVQVTVVNSGPLATATVSRQVRIAIPGVAGIQVSSTATCLAEQPS